ncbi:MAG: hypothetical protein LBH81_01770 [Rickettsiales bacterium]|jgi:hypothetical protein|nr:hypothetical protein [Rickettsiales bacterium]
MENHGKILFNLMIVSLIALAFASIILQAAVTGASRRVQSLNAESVRLDKSVKAAQSEFSRQLSGLSAVQAGMFPEFAPIKPGSRISKERIGEK